MEIKKKKIADKIYLLRFAKQRDLTLTFVRIEAYYESPEFKGKIFTIGQFKKWYTKENKGKFTYYQDWTGFNVPSKVLKPFRKGYFDPLSEQEEKLLKIFKKEKGEFYIIAVYGKKNFRTLKHEIAHALFHTNKSYKEKVTKIIKRYKTGKIKRDLLASHGYNKKVLIDEIQAYCVAYEKVLNANFPKKMREQVQEIFERYYQIK
ncbi:MAG: ABC transporter ATP-binding protein [Nanoarchaeota archaeon]|nr:ABC transporter ATP-binding protein [Nanoarchaeota archaeon]